MYISLTIIIVISALILALPVSAYSGYRTAFGPEEEERDAKEVLKKYRWRIRSKEAWLLPVCALIVLTVWFFDTEFGKAAENLVALTAAPFYAVEWTPTTFGSTGGVKTDEEQRVLNAEGNAIAGLYAAGEMSNRYFYNENYMLGGSLGLYATCGRRAGAAAVADLGM